MFVLQVSSNLVHELVGLDALLHHRWSPLRWLLRLGGAMAVRLGAAARQDEPPYPPTRPPTRSGEFLTQRQFRTVESRVAAVVVPYVSGDHRLLGLHRRA